MKKELSQRVCLLCKKEYKLNIKYSKKQMSESKFCSRECQYKGRDRTYKGRKANIPELNCQICGKIFKEYLSHRKYKSIHCSRECAGVHLGKNRKGIPMNPETTRKMVETKRKNGSYNFSEEHLRKIREYQSKRNRTGSKNPNWKGGYDVKNALRKTKAYKEWRRAIFLRDNYMCVQCGIRFIKGVTGRVYLEADHIKPYAHFPELRLSLDNGRTLCKSCHIKTETYGYKSKKL